MSRCHVEDTASSAMNNVVALAKRMLHGLTETCFFFFFFFFRVPLGQAHYRDVFIDMFGMAVLARATLGRFLLPILSGPESSKTTSRIFVCQLSVLTREAVCHGGLVAKICDLRFPEAKSFFWWIPSGESGDRIGWWCCSFKTTWITRPFALLDSWIHWKTLDAMTGARGHRLMVPPPGYKFIPRTERCLYGFA